MDDEGAGEGSGEDSGEDMSSWTKAESAERFMDVVVVVVSWVRSRYVYAEEMRK